MIIRAIRVPLRFRLVLQIGGHMVLNNFPTVGNRNFTRGKNVLYWGVDKQKTAGGDPAVKVRLEVTQS